MRRRTITELRPAAAGSPIPRPATVLRRTVVDSPDPYRATPLALARALARRHGLTPTESAVLEAFVGGCERADLAAELGVTDNTMRSHVRALCRKMGLPRLENVHRALLRECIGWLAECELRHLLVTRLSG